MQSTPNLGGTLRLIGRHMLSVLGDQSEPARKWLVSWISELADAQWMRPADVGSQFPKAKSIDDSTFCFPVTGLLVEIQVLISFSSGVVLITALKHGDNTHDN